MAWIDYRKVYDFVPHSWILECLDMLDNVRSLSLLLRKVKASYEWGRKEFKLNHLLFMDDLKLFGKSEDQIDSLVQTVFIFSEDIGMEFGLKKYGVVILKKRKLVKLEFIFVEIHGIHLPKLEIMKEVDENGYTTLAL